MKKGLAVINGYCFNANNQYKVNRLKEELLKLDILLDCKDAISLLPVSMGDKTLIPSLKEYDFVIDLDKDIYLAKAISDSTLMINNYESFVLSDDKMLSILALKNSGVNVPSTIPAPLCYVSPSKEKVEVFLFKVEKTLGFPLVFKLCHGSLGKQVELIHNHEELLQKEMNSYSQQHLYEKFLSSHQGHDYRVMVIGDSVIAVMERKNDHDFRSNIALGGKGKDVTETISEEVKEIALKAAKALHLDYAGIDIGLDDNDKPVFLEANGNAFFTEIEKVTGKNIAKALAIFIKKKIA